MCFPETEIFTICATKERLVIAHTWVIETHIESGLRQISLRLTQTYLILYSEDMTSSDTMRQPTIHCSPSTLRMGTDVPVLT